MSRVSDWIWYALSESDPRLLRIIAVGLWSIWRNRNRVAHGQAPQSISSCCTHASHLLKQFEFREILGYGPLNSSPRNNSVLARFFSDGSWSKESGIGGWASLLCEGNSVIRCFAACSTDCGSAYETELKGLVSAFRMASALSLGSAIFFSDSTDILWAFQSGSGPSEQLAHIFEEGVALLRTNPGWRIDHVGRDSNGLADWLANKARTQRWHWEFSYAIPWFPPSVLGSVFGSLA